MKTLQVNSVLIWQAPEGVTGLHLHKYMGRTFICADTDISQTSAVRKIVDILPPDIDYTHLTTVPELSEDECVGMVYKDGDKYIIINGNGIKHETPNAALYSFLQSKGFTPSQCYAVFKR